MLKIQKNITVFKFYFIIGIRIIVIMTLLNLLTRAIQYKH